MSNSSKNLALWTRTLAMVATAAALAMPGLAVAAVPSTMAIEGALTSTGGGAVADGNYALTFNVLDAQAGKVVWSEGPTTVAVKGGGFQAALGAKTPLTPAVAVGDRWLQVQVGTDPALPSVPLRSQMFALRAGIADGLECSGCIKVSQIDAAALQPYAKTTDLSAYAKVTDLAAYAKSADLSGYAKASELADYVKAASLAKVAGTGSYADLLNKPALSAVASSGSYADLTNKPVLAKLGDACGTGLVMKGIKVDGAYDCVSAAIDAASLPADGLDEVSGGLLTTQFVETAPSAKAPFDIADAFPAGVTDEIIVADFGIAQALSVAIDLTNSNIAKVKVTVYDPNGVAYVLHNTTGSGTALKTSYPDATKPASGDLTTWIGKNPKGKWSISVADIEGISGKTDGKVTAWSIKVQTLSSQKVAAKGALLLANLASAPFPCTASVFGAQYASFADKAIYICNGTTWYPLGLTALGTMESPAVNCKDLLTKAPLTKSGVFWVDPDGSGQGEAGYQVYCDMTTDGGGWTLVWSNLRGGTGKPMTNMNWSTAINTPPVFFKGSPSENLESFGVYTGLKRWAQLGGKELRYSWAYDYGQPISQSYRCNYTLNASASYTIGFSGCAQLVGSVAPGLVTYSAGKAFNSIDNDPTACSKQYSNTPWWYNNCWDGSINGGGENSGGSYYNGAYWFASQTSWGQSNAQGAGNGWIFVR
jgi:subtilisin-like proprotein convertase family protein